jgi:hypothetical protein
MKLLFSDDILRKNIGAKSSKYVIEQKGAIIKIMNELNRKHILD